MASRRPRPASKGISAAFGASLFVIAGVLALGFYASLRDEDAAAKRSPVVEQAEEPSNSPFDDIPPEPRPAPRGSSRADRGSFTPAPDDLEESALWQTALEQAAEAEEWLAKAVEARAAEDHADYQRNAKEAKRLFDAAFGETALWEEQLVEAHGERDPAVRRILRTRTDWTQKLLVLRKTTSR